MKRCWRCKVEYTNVEEAYGIDRKEKDGRNRTCKECNRQLAKARDHKRRAEWAKTEEGREQLAAFYKRMYARDPDGVKRRMREWRKAHPEQKRAGARRQKAAALGCEGTHTAGDVRRQYVLQSGRCFWCDIPIAQGYPSSHVDHLVPLQRGGDNWPSNIVITCPRCNGSKKAKWPLDWALAVLPKLIAQAGTPDGAVPA